MTGRAALFFALSLAASTGASAQEQEKLTLSKSLLFDCSIAPKEDPAKVSNFEVSYFLYAHEPGRPQVNFLDTGKLFIESTGWAPKGRFALSRLTSDGRLFVWVGETPGSMSPKVEQAMQLTPIPSQTNRATISILNFSEDDSEVSAREFGGSCQTLSGKAAWDHFQKGGSE